MIEETNVNANTESEELTAMMNLNKKLSEQNGNLKIELSRLAMANDAFIKTITVKDSLLTRITTVLEKVTDLLAYHVEDTFKEVEQVSEGKNADDFFNQIKEINNASDDSEGWDDFLG